VLDAAMREFGAHGFSGGSLNVIAREAAVAKGSLFQYFDDKLDLFGYVCDVTSQRIRSELERQITDLDPQRPFFVFLEDLLLAWVGYFHAHPVERGVTAATNLEMDGAVRSAVRGVANGHYLEVLAPLLASAHARGDLRADADLPVLTAHLLLLAPHLALAPFIEGLDPVLALHGRPPEELAEPVHRLVSTLAHAYNSEQP
jgi:AcrR family transcriptional regulator